MPEGGGSEKGTESLLSDLIGEHFPSLWKELGSTIEGANRTHNYGTQKDLLQDSLYSN